MSKDEETRNINSRRRNILFLIHKYLQDNGFYSSAEALKTEARLLTTDFEVCDNIDLDSMYLEFGSYYQLKFGKFPRILRKIKPIVSVEVTSKRAATQQQQHKKKKEFVAVPTGEAKTTAAAVAAAATVATADNFSDLQVTVTKLSTESSASGGNAGAGGDAVGEEAPKDTLQQLQAVQHFTTSFDPDLEGPTDELLNSHDWHHLVDMVRSTIMRDNLCCRWSDIFGNINAIETIKEAVVTPLKFPKIFAANDLQPWRSVLLHGPPGSGKTLLAKTLYAETRDLHVTFFNITSSIIISKWRGDSEKIMRVIFRLARKHAPSIIFLDEIEGLTSRRDRPTDHESSKRLKNELLQLLDGMENQVSAGAAANANNPGIFVLASTNLPWDIDEAFLRRFEKKLLVQLPNRVERMQLIKKLLPQSLRCSEQQLEQFAKISDGFTGDEIRLACKELSMQQVRRITRPSEKHEEIPMVAAFERIRPLSEKLMLKHIEWNRLNGS